MNVLFNSVSVTGAGFIPHSAGKDYISLVKAVIPLFICGVHGLIFPGSLIKLLQYKGTFLGFCQFRYTCNRSLDFRVKLRFTI